MEMNLMVFETGINCFQCESAGVGRLLSPLPPGQCIGAGNSTIWWTSSSRMDHVNHPCVKLNWQIFIGHCQQGET